MEAIYFYVTLFILDVVGYAFWVNLTGKCAKGWKKVIPFFWIFA